MPAANTQKLKLLYLMEFFRTETDPTHGLSMPQIIEKLAEKGISAERKSIYSDIETLREVGFDIRKLPRQPVEYALTERDFELPELMLLVDAVQSSRFLSEGTSKALVKSIQEMASVNERTALKKQVHVHGRPSTQSKSDFLTVDTIQEAMAEKRKLGFLYFRYDARKQKVARKDGRMQITSPVCLTYSDDNYYLVAFSDEDGQIRNYRVDRMESVQILEDKAQRNDAIRNYDAAEVGKCAFGMYGGERMTVTLRAKAEVMNVIIDRFGPKVDSQPIDDGAAARITARVMASPVFFGWLAQMGDSVVIESPVRLRDEYVAFLEKIAATYA